MALYDRIEHSGNAITTTLNADITPTATSATLDDATGWPTGGVGPFYLTVDAGTVTEEKILAASRSGSTLNGLTRGVDNSSPATHSAGAPVVHGFTAVEADEANQIAHMVGGQIIDVGDSLWGVGVKTLGRVAAGADGTVLKFDSTQPAGVAAGLIGADSLAAGAVLAAITPGSISTTMLASGAVTAAKLDPTIAATIVVVQDPAARFVSVGNAQNTAALTSASYVDFGGTVSVTVPAWATAAYVTTYANGLGGGGSATGSFRMKSVLNSVDGTARPIGILGTEAHDVNLVYVDKFTGLSAGTITLKTQAERVSGTGQLLFSGSLVSFVDFDVQFTP